MNKGSFEDKVEELEKIVEELEKGDMSLELSLKKFEEGMKLSKECSDILEKSEKKIKIILEEEGKIEERDFEGE